MNKRLWSLLLLLPFLFVACIKNDPMANAEKHLKIKVQYLQDKAKVVESPQLKIINIDSIFPKEKPMPTPWAVMIRFTMVHFDENNEVMRENFRVIFEFEDPYWIPAKLESEQIWNKNAERVPWREITRESNKDAWSMVNSLLGLSGP